MNYEEYKAAYFTDPQPEPRFTFRGLVGVSISVKDYDNAIAYYTNVLGAPAYVEDQEVRGWQLGNSWLSLFPSTQDDARNSDVSIELELESVAQAEELQQAMVEAGGTGTEPVDTFLYYPIRMCAVKDPFGLQWVVYSRLD